MLITLASLLLVGCSGPKTTPGDDSTPGTDSGGGFDTSFNGTCSSGKEWSNGNQGSEKMNPGEACIDCHTNGDGPRFTLAGTVMGAIHDPDDCDGPKSVTVTVTDADGAVQTLTTNSAGNFYSYDRLATPYTVSLDYDGRTRVMEGSQTTTDCNSCHTEDGAEGAPGRIVVP